MNKKIRVSARGLTKEFSLFKSQQEKLKATITGEKTESFWALRGLSFDVYDGDVIGIVGTNGSGKSTLLNILSGVIPQTSGEFKVDGEISVVAINEGLNWELTGRENIRLKQLMMGKTNKQIDAQMDDIIEFSELGDFVDQPVKNYSSGMRSKLGFSIAVHDNPDIMIVDEALSVGDSNFAKKAMKKIKEFVAEGRTIFFVSHNINEIRSFTTKTMWIQYGEMIDFADTKTVTAEYEKFNKEFILKSPEEQHEFVMAGEAARQEFTLDVLKERLLSEGTPESEVKSILKRRNFTGFNTFQLWGMLALLVAALIVLVGRFV